MVPITVIIVDDSQFIRTLFSDMLGGEPDIQVIGTAANASEAREMIKRLNPDVLTLDIEMPGLDGLSFLEKIMTLRPMPVVMASTLTQKGAGETLRALELGAVDYISKPLCTDGKNTLATLKDELTAKIRAAARANMHRARPKKNDTPISSFRCADHARLIAIGSSTGGVEALRFIFSQLPANAPPLVMVQHMPKTFTGSFAARLDAASRVKVHEALDGDVLIPGHAYLAPGDQHLTIEKSAAGYMCRLHDGPTVSGHRPSVDVLFHSVAKTAGAHAIGVMLTGMGRDGADGMAAMRAAGAFNIGQSESSCIVYGMPRAAMEAGAVHEEKPLGEIAKRFLQYCEEVKT